MAHRAVPKEWAPGPARPDRPGAEAHLWLAVLGEGLWTSERALRSVLGRYLGEDPAAVEIARPAGGKPRLAKRRERLCFNLSHSGGLALVGVSTVEIGVDVQTVDPGRRHLAIAERRLGTGAGAAVRAATEAGRPAVFAEHWARFEARQKCLGLGVFDEAPGDATVAVASLDVPGGYAAAIAVAGERLPPVRRFLLP